MHRAHLIRMYPTKEQEVMLKKTAGAARYAYNWALDRWKSMYSDWMESHSNQKPSAFGLVKIWTTDRPDWAHETAYCTQQSAIHNLGKAFQSLWRGTGKYPTFHKKGRKDSFTVNNDKARIYGDRISLPNIGRVKLAEEPRFEGKVMSYTVSYYAGQWHVSIQYELSDSLPQPTNPTSVVGIDVGLKHVAVASDGTVSIWDMPSSPEESKNKKAYEILKKLAEIKHFDFFTDRLVNMLKSRKSDLDAAISGSVVSSSESEIDFYYQGQNVVSITQRELLLFKNIGTLLTEKTINRIRPLGRVMSQKWFFNFLFIL